MSLRSVRSCCLHTLQRRVYDLMKASITIHVESLWTNRAELILEAELDNPHSKTSQEVVSMMFEAARLMASKARGESERALSSQEPMNRRNQELDEREVRLDERDKRLTLREESASARDYLADERQARADVREPDQEEHAWPTLGISHEPQYPQRS